MKHSIATRMEHIAPFHVMKLLARAKELEAQGKIVVHMEIGEPDFDTPAPIVMAGINALDKGYTHYTPALGLNELRVAIANFYKSNDGIDVDKNRIVVAPGSSSALQLVCGVVINPGDEVILTDPGYPCNKHFVQIAGGIPTFIELDEQNNYEITLDDVKNKWTNNTRAIMLASPSNPTGVLIDTKTLDDIAAFAEQKNAYLILDEIYHGLVYDEDVKSFVGRCENVFIINSFSKYFCMTGWRVGWLVAPAEFIDSIDRLAQNIFLAAPTVAQHAALEAFQPATLDILESYRKEFKERRDYLYHALNDLGFGMKGKPQGAFYLYANSARFSSNSFQLAEDLLENINVAITPGIDFGKHLAQEHVRFAYTRSMEQLELGVSRLASYLK